MWAIVKDCNFLWATEKFQWTLASLLQIFVALHATAVRLGSNGAKTQVCKNKNTLSSKYAIDIFEHLNDFKWKKT